MSREELPDLYESLDYREYLQAWFDAKKRSNPRFSHRLFARLAGQQSPSTLLHVISGRRNLSPANVARFCAAMKLGEDDAGYFGHLVQLDQARSVEERERAWLNVAARRRFRRAERIVGQRIRLLSCWYYTAIHELANHPGFRLDHRWVARTLRPAITQAQAREALSFLLEVGMLVERADGGVRPAAPTLVTEHDTAQLAIWYHQQMMVRAREALETTPPQERLYGGLTVSVTRELVPRLRRELAAFQERMLALCDASAAEVPADRVYQLSLQFFPLTEWIQGAEE